MNPLSGVLNEAWQMYKTFARHLLAIAFVIYLAAAVIAALLGLAGGTVGAVLGSLVQIVAAFLLQATLVKAVQDVRDGRADMSIGDTVRAAVPYLGAVAGASILAGIAITIGLILIIVPGLYLITIWAVIVPVIVLEQSGAMASFGRSQRLVRGNGWHVFGTLVLVVHHHAGGGHNPRPDLLGAAALARQRAELDHLGHADRPVPRPGRDARLLPALRDFPGADGAGRELRRLRADAVTEGTRTRRAACLMIFHRQAAVVIWPPAPPTGRGRRA